MAIGDILSGARNFAYELSGAGDIMRGSRELARGNVAGGLGRIALGAVGAIPVAGVGLRAASAAARLSSGSRLVQAATKARPVQAAIKAPAVQAAARPVAAVARPVRTAATKVSTSTQGAARVASRPLVKANARTPLGRVAATVTSPYSISRIISPLTIPQQAAASRPTFSPVPAGAAERSWEQTRLAANLMGTNVPRVSPPSTQTPGFSGPGTQAPIGGQGAPGGGAVGVPTFEAPSFGDTGVTTGTGDTMSTGGLRGGGVADFLMTGGGQPSTGGAGQVGVPGQVQVAGSEYLADLAASAAASRARQAGLRESFSQGLMGVRGTAADILGGRSAAIRGQGVTGVRREFQTGLAAESQRQIQDQDALARSYGDAVARAYQEQAQRIAEQARVRSQQAAQIRRMG